MRNVLVFSRPAVIVSALCFAALTLHAEDLQSILSRMNAAAPAFRSLSADLQMLTYTAVIDDTTTDNGNLKMKKGKGDTVRAVIDFAGGKDASQAREVGFFGNMVRIYYPNGHYYQDYDLGKNSNLLSQFLLLGFGSSGDDLSKSYTITPEGTEKVGDFEATKLQLVPKDPKVLEHLAKVEIWIPVGAANPVQQQFYESNGNYRKVSYTNIHLNPSLKGDLEIQMQPGTQKRGS